MNQFCITSRTDDPHGCLANSNLLATVTGPVHTVTNTWEPNRDVLASKQNKAGSSVISQYNYAVNAIGQRTAVTTSGSAFPAAPSWACGYAPLGQVISADSSVNTSDRSYQYDTIGNTVVNTDAGNLFNYRFSNKPLDFETGLYYYGYRYYDPMTGRWPSRDPIGEKGGLNLYTLAKNNGPNEVDVLGLFYEPPIPIEPPPPKVFKTFSLVSGIIIAADFIVDKAIADMSDCKIGTCPTIQERTAFGDCCVDHFHVAIAAAATSFSAASIACGAYGPWGATICLSAIQFENKKSIDKINFALDTCIARCTK